MKSLLQKFIIVLIMAKCGQIDAQPFIDQHNHLPSLQSASTAWADMDGDGDLDLALIGFSSVTAEVSYIYRNDNGVMIAIDSSIVKVANGSVNWGDYDNDGDLDLLLNGQRNGSPVTQLYRNDSSVFVPVSSGLPNIIGAERWMDFDHDGRLDVIVSGVIDSVWQDTTMLFHNNGNGFFSFFASNLLAIGASDVEVGDIDNDSLPDLFITGQVNNTFQAIAAIYRNNGSGNFTIDTVGLKQLFTGTGKWGDVDHDGDLDLLYDGIEDDNTAYSLIYLNDGVGGFSELPTNLPPSGEPGYVDWADIDHDGDLDVLLPENLMRNDGNGVFTDISPWPTQTIYALPAQFLDFNNDGDEDFFILFASGGGESTIFLNDLNNSVRSKDFESGISIFPNPTSTDINLKSSSGKIQEYKIYNLIGNIVSCGKGYDTDFVKVNLNDLKSGIYFIEVKSGSSYLQSKFIKE